MRKTDYSRIADKYDKNKFRQKVKPDDDLEDFIHSSGKPQYSVLDLACGTGIYLANQTNYLANINIHWNGLDASEEMLKIAKTKTEEVTYIQGFAEDLPYSSESFDFVVNNFAFHHFQKKSEVLDEAVRVIKKDGVFKIHNISIHDMEKWWIYQLFPSALFEDLKRYWPKDLIFYELSARGFDVETRMEYLMNGTKLADYMDHVYNRDISVLTIISDEEYRQGIEMMEYRLRKDPEAILFNDFAEISFVATKK
ncbi:class I SAM-dependent methyltransferase [Desulfosporosinus sp. PR]|uniref:class I SAM-dependent methyltransferase n=1 Tax=Candidatus Desulfosporosinus nitrosoreducens TaxID=3401928 RepID=UPI0027EDF5A3|nr:class I SAM-dependent methyltransferase [Desulfosporosinus sp. PR]MDQ7094595.1 class I SAM-dependent methyltransferase [Desulfosporosinus sp. PR]